MEAMVWVVNIGDKPIETCAMALKKWITFEPKRPVQIPLNTYMDLKRNYSVLTTTNEPEKYFVSAPMKQLIVRDAGIGDLLLLEPIMRALAVSGNREISIASRYPEVFENNGYIRNNIRMDAKENLKVDFKAYDTWEDLRSYSELAPSRDKKHRTDVFLEKFNIEVADKEPKLFFSESELKTQFLHRKKDARYIGIQLDASHTYRRYDKGIELIDYILKASPENHVVILGSWDFVKYSQKSNRVINLQAKTTTREVINIVRELDAFIGVDSGLMHAALTMHIPCVCIFSIISPDLRLRYYTGPRAVIQKDIPCKSCGNFHMVDCKHVDKKSDALAIAPCLDIDPKDIYDALSGLEKGNVRAPAMQPITVPVIGKPKNKITMPIIVQNESKNLPRFIELVMSHPCIGKVIAIDGGSTDNTVDLLEKSGAKVYVHAYDKSYHDMQAMQRNYSFSFVQDGERCIFMDIDECFSKELSEYLYVLAESEIEYAEISRRTYAYYADINDPAKRIKDYPDYQPRYYRWHRRFKFVGSPHHQTLNVPTPIRIQKDIIHFEREGKDRDALELLWSNMHKKTKEIYA